MAFTNINICRSFNVPLSTNLVALSSQICSEVIISNKTGQGVLVFDGGYSTSNNGFLLSADQDFTFRGISNSEQVSAKTVAGAGMLYYRTQYFSYFTQGS